MKHFQFLTASFVMLLLLASCVKDEDVEIFPPEIEILSPRHCDTVYFDEAVTYRFRILDKSQVGLGNFSMDIHNNFNHHSHGSHISCAMDPVKDPQHPYEEVWIENLPDDKFDYVLEMEISMPLLKNENQEHDQGDYHFHIYITNTEGYQTFTSLDIKLLKRPD